MSDQISLTKAKSLPHEKITNNDIKKGLEKIKLAQLQVLQQLRKDAIDSSKDNLQKSQFLHQTSKKQEYGTFKSTVHEISRAPSWDKTRNIEIHYSNKPESKESFENERFKLLNKVQNLQNQKFMIEASYKKLQSQAQIAFQKIRHHQNEEKFQKTQKEDEEKAKILKEKDFYYEQLKRMQEKQLKKLSSEGSNHFHYLIKEIQKIYNLCEKVIEKQNIEEKQDYEKHFTNIILYLKSLQKTSFEEQHGYISGTVREDIKKIEEELNKETSMKKEELIELKSQNDYFEQKVKRLQEHLTSAQRQNQSMYLNNKKLTIETNQQKEEIQSLKNENNYLQNQLSTQSVPQQTVEIRVTGEKQLKNTIKRLKDQIQRTELESRAKAKQEQGKVQELRKKLAQMSMINEQLRNEKKQQNLKMNNLKSEYSKLRGEVDEMTKNMTSEKQEWKQMVETIRRMQEDRVLFEEKDKQLQQKISILQRKIKSDYEKYSQIEEKLSAEIVKLRQENRGNLKNFAQLKNVRKKAQQNERILQYNAQIDQLWSAKNHHYGVIDNILRQNH